MARRRIELTAFEITRESHIIQSKWQLSSLPLSFTLFPCFLTQRRRRRLYPYTEPPRRRFVTRAHCHDEETYFFFHFNFSFLSLFFCFAGARDFPAAAINKWTRSGALPPKWISGISRKSARKIYARKICSRTERRDECINCRPKSLQREREIFRESRRTGSAIFPASLMSCCGSAKTRLFSPRLFTKNSFTPVLCRVRTLSAWLKLTRCRAIFLVESRSLGRNFPHARPLPIAIVPLSNFRRFPFRPLVRSLVGASNACQIRILFFAAVAQGCFASPARACVYFLRPILEVRIFVVNQNW